MPAVAATTAPLESVFNSDEVTEVIAKEVVVACVVVAWSAVTLPSEVAPLTVRPAFNVWSWEKVLRVVVPKFVVRVTAPVEPDTWRGYVAASDVTPVLVMTPVEGT